MLKIAIATAALFSFATVADAAACRDSKGKFVKCPAAAAKSPTSGVTKGKDGKCRDAKGHFAKCRS